MHVLSLSYLNFTKCYSLPCFVTSHTTYDNFYNFLFQFIFIRTPIHPTKRAHNINQVVWTPVAKNSDVSGEYRIQFPEGTTFDQCAYLYTRAELVAHIWCVKNRCERKKKKLTIYIKIIFLYFIFCYKNNLYISD
jgi:hypothetical protein